MSLLTGRRKRRQFLGYNNVPAGSAPHCERVREVVTIALRIVTVLLALSLLACDSSSYKEPYALYNAPFDPQVETIDEVVRFIYEIADKWNLETEQKDRGSAKFLTFGQDAFHIFLILDDDTTISIGNMGFGTALSLMVMDYGHMPIAELDRLTEEVKGGLEERFGLEFCAKDPYDSSICE